MAKTVERAVLERLPIWLCSVRGFACRPCYQERGALLPHLFTLTRLRPPLFGLRAPARQARTPLGETSLPRRSSRLEEPRAKAGGVFSVPLSFGLPRPGVTRRTALRSSDFPPAFAPIGRFSEAGSVHYQNRSLKRPKDAKADDRLAYCSTVIFSRFIEPAHAPRPKHPD